MAVQEQGLHRTHQWLRAPPSVRLGPSLCCRRGRQCLSQSWAAWQGTCGPLCWLLGPPGQAGLEQPRVSQPMVKLSGEHSQGMPFTFSVGSTSLTWQCTVVYSIGLVVPSQSPSRKWARSAERPHNFQPNPAVSSTSASSGTPTCPKVQHRYLGQIQIHRTRKTKKTSPLALLIKSLCPKDPWV